MRLEFTVGAVCAAALLGAGALPGRGDEARAREVRFTGVIRSVDEARKSFVLPVSIGRDGDPRPAPVDVVVLSSPATRFEAPGGDGEAARAASFADAAAGLRVTVVGELAPDRTLRAARVLVFRRARGEAGEARARPAAEGAPRAEGAERPADGWLHGRVRAVDAARKSFLFEWREVREGRLVNLRALVLTGPTTRFELGAAKRDGDARPAAVFQDIQPTATVHVRATRVPEGLSAAEVRIWPPRVRQPAARREGDAGGAPREGDRAPRDRER